MNRRIEVLILVDVILVAACHEPVISDGPWVSETSQHGDTTAVRTVSGSVWEKPAELVEEFRLGSIDGTQEMAFGAISQVAVADDGSLFVFDPQVPQIYRFGATGEFLGRVGREGEGPGEYTGDVTGMAVSGGRLLLADPGTGRISAFDLDGTYVASLGPMSGLRSLFSPTLAPRPEGGVAVSVLTVQWSPGVELPTPWPIGLEYRSAEGTVIDTVLPQTLLGDRGRVEAGPAGNGVLVTSNEQFLFELRGEDGAVLRHVMPYERVEYTEAEKRMLGKALQSAAEADGRSEASAAPLKPSYLEYFFSPNGHVWARRPVADRPGDPSWKWPRHQPSVLDVFDRGGRYLGVVPLPANSAPVAAADNHLYLIELGAFDEPYLVRYRVRVPR